MVLVLWLWCCGVVVVVFWWLCLVFLWVLCVVLVVMFRGRSRCRLVVTTKTYHLWPQPPSLSRSHGPAHNAHHRTTPDKAALFAHKHTPPPVEVWFFCNNFFRGNFVLKKTQGSHQLRLGIRPPARLGGAMRRSSANPLPGPLPLGR